MLFFRQRTLEQKVTSAVGEALATREAAYSADISALRDEIATLQADVAGRDAELALAMDRRIQAERQRQDAGVSGLLQSVKAVRDEVQQVRESIPDPEPKILQLTDALAGLSASVRQTNDLAAYILESPREESAAVVAPAAVSESPAVNKPWIRPMGAH